MLNNGSLDFKQYSQWVKGQQPQSEQTAEQTASDLRIKTFLTKSLDDSTFTKAIYSKLAGTNVIDDDVLKLMMMRGMRGL